MPKDTLGTPQETFIKETPIIKEDFGFAPIQETPQDFYNRRIIPVNTATVGRSIKLRNTFCLSGVVDVLTTPVTVAETTTETDLYSFRFSRDEWHPEMILRFSFSGVYSNTNGVDTFDLKVKMTDSGGATTYSTITSTAAAVTNVGFNGIWTGIIYTIGSSGTIQPDLIGRMNNVNKVEADSATVAINTQRTQTFSLTITWSANTAGNTAAIRQALLEVLN